MAGGRLQMAAMRRRKNSKSPCWKSPFPRGSHMLSFRTCSPVLRAISFALLRRCATCRGDDDVSALRGHVSGWRLGTTATHMRRLQRGSLQKPALTPPPHPRHHHLWPPDSMH